MTGFEYTIYFLLGAIIIITFINNLKEDAAMGESYVTISGKIEAISKAAIKIDGRWIARSCIHGADEKQIDHADVGDEIEFRIFEWLAKKEGFV